MDQTQSPASKHTPRRPTQARSIQTYEKIMGAGEKLFIRDGFHNILADDIAREAGVSVGSFYSYFKDKRHAGSHHRKRQRLLKR
ncbi:MAG: TetR/AcrR family transcriptional regulator [Anaerolineae bacterium]|nr:TetR/AcrR family transcriptional regulator [Anaerolineae bacterium]